MKFVFHQPNDEITEFEINVKVYNPIFAFSDNSLNFQLNNSILLKIVCDKIYDYKDDMVNIFIKSKLSSFQIGKLKTYK